MVEMEGVGMGSPDPVVDPGGPRGSWPPGPVKIGHKKMAAKDGHIDFMFLSPPYPAAGSATEIIPVYSLYSHQ